MSSEFVTRVAILRSAKLIKLMGAPVTKDIKAFKRSYAQRPIIKHAALAAGYSEKLAKQGLKPLPKVLRSFVLAKQRKLNKLADLGRSVDPQQQEDIARGAILANIAAGKDQAVQSIKMAGQDKRVNMFVADSVQGVFVLEMPAHLSKHLRPQVIDATAVKQLADE